MRIRPERDVAAVGTQRGAGAVTVRLGCSRIEAHTLRLARRAIVDEDVERAVGVFGYQRGGRGERHVTPIGTDRGIDHPAGVVAAWHGQADARGSLLDTVAHEDVVAAVGVCFHETVGTGIERDVTPIRADRGAPLVAVRLDAPRRDAGELGAPLLPIPNEDVLHAIGVAVHQVACRGGERDVAPVGADRRVCAGTRVGARSIDTHQLGRPQVPVKQHQDERGVPIARDDVGRIRLVDDVAAVRADHGAPARVIALRSARADVDSFDRARLPVMDEDVRRAVGVAFHQVRGPGDEDDETAVGADRLPRIDVPGGSLVRHRRSAHQSGVAGSRMKQRAPGQCRDRAGECDPQGGAQENSARSMSRCVCN